MAGIGFEIRKIIRRDNLTSTLHAYSFSGVVSSGPWVLSIVGMLIVGFMITQGDASKIFVSQFQVSVTYLIAASLILSGLLQHGFTRYIADQFFLEKPEKLIANLHGAMCLLTLLSGLFGQVIAWRFLSGTTFWYRLLMVCGFVILSNIWLVANLLSGLKAYRAIVWIFLASYTTVVGLCYLLKGYGLSGLLLGFIIGQLLLLFSMMILIYRYYPLKYLMQYEFLQRNKMYLSLVATGFLYNLGVWADKIVFWYYPTTGYEIIGSLHASVIYDLPIFLAYLSIIPGMAVFLLRMETDFVEHYNHFYDAVRNGGTLALIGHARNEMVLSARQGILDIIKVQGLAVLFIFVVGQKLLQWLGISPLYYHLLCIDVVGAGLQVVFLGLLNICFYLDKRIIALWLGIIFVVLNFSLSYTSIKLGVYFYGYGFATALLLTNMIAIVLLDTEFSELEYETFMLQ